MAWPGMVEYSAAVQNQRASFLAPELKAATVVTNRLGLPKVCSGAFAIVYELTNGADRWAIRCFTKEVGDLKERYAAIADHLRSAALPQFVAFDYLKDGILVNGKPYPIMKMQWVDGVTLGRYVEEHLGEPARLLDLAAQFGELSADLEQKRIGHGDLSAENVLVTNGRIALIDYDGMYVPKLAGKKARELGNPAFQHPARDESHFGPEIDRFSILVLATALAALAADPSLFARHAGGNGILFSPADLRNPKGSALFKALHAARDRTVRDLAGELARWCETKPGKLGKLPPIGKLAASASPAATVSITVAVPNGTGAAAPATVAAPPSAAPAGRWWRRRGARPAPSAPAPPAPVPAPAPSRPAPAARPAAAPVPAGPAPAPAPAAAGRRWWQRRGARPAPSAPAPPAPARPPAAPAPPGAAPAGSPSAAAVDWSGPFAAALGLGVFGVLLAPETRSLSVLLGPALAALAAFGDAAYQRTGEPGGLRASVGASAFAAGLFGVLLAPETGSASMLALPLVPALVYGMKRGAAGP